MCHLEVMFGSSRVVQTPNNHSFKKLRACLSVDKQFKADVVGARHAGLRFSFCSAILMHACSSDSKLPRVHNMASDSMASSSHPSSEEEAAQKEKKK